MSKFITAFRMLEGVIRELDRIGDENSEKIRKQLIQPKRDMEDLIW